jgi:hypothetical protein
LRLRQRHPHNHSGTFTNQLFNMGENLNLRGVLTGHGGWITSIATTAEDSTMILTASRDKVRF